MLINQGAEPHNSDVYDPQQLEECDAFPADTALLMRVDRKLQTITHQVKTRTWVANIIKELNSVNIFLIENFKSGRIFRQVLVVINGCSMSAQIRNMCHQFAFVMTLTGSSGNRSYPFKRILQMNKGIGKFRIGIVRILGPSQLLDTSKHQRNPESLLSLHQV